MKSKKGLSEIIAYVLLVVIAISLSVLVYNWMKGQLPGQVEKCPKDVSIIIDDYSCDINKKNITLNLKNKGLFDIEGVIIRVSTQSEGLISCVITDDGDFNYHAFIQGRGSLKTGEKAEIEKSYDKCLNNGNTLKRIEIVPVIDGLLCDKSIINQRLEDC